MRSFFQNKKTLLLAGLILIAALLLGAIALGGAARASTGYQTEEIRRGSLQETFEASGMVRARQSALLIWKASGTVGAVNAQAGESVSRGQELASLDPGSLSPEMILARVELIEARRALEELQQSSSQRALAMKAVEEAELALESARHPEQGQAEAAQAAASAEKALQQARQRYEILSTPASQEAIDQAYANLVLSENKLNETKNTVARIQRQLDKPEGSLAFFESKGDYRKLLRTLELQLASQQLDYDEARRRYEQLLAPPDPVELAAAEADLDAAQAEYDRAQREVARAEDGLTPGEIALLEAELTDSQRAFERVKDGPAQGDLLAAEARVTAAEAALESVHVFAPFDGVVTEVASEAGSRVQLGTPAFRIDDLSSLLVEVLVSEIDIAKVETGQQVTLRLDAFSPAFATAAGEQDSTFSGKVVEVLGVGDVLNGLTVYPVTVEILDGGRWVRPGMSATATFIVNEYEDVLLVPNHAIRYENGERVVYLMRGGDPVKQPVRLGATDGLYSQLLEGELQAGDQVVTVFPEEN